MKRNIKIIVLILVLILLVGLFCFIKKTNNLKNENVINTSNSKIESVTNTDNTNSEISEKNTIDIFNDKNNTSGNTSIQEKTEENTIKSKNENTSEKESNNINKSNNTNTTNTNNNIKENKSSSNNTIKKEENTVIKTETNEKNTEEKLSESNTSEKKGKTVVIDPGHQKRGDSSKEPIGPGATEKKAKVTTGATGTTTKQLESELNLKVSLLLRTELQKRGYTVIMTRTSQDVNISNSERAEIANKANADAFVRIHADSAESSKAVGMSTLCQTNRNQYNGNIAEKSYKLSKKILDNMVKTTGAKSRGVTRTDNMSGINWAKVPTTIIEMGFLSNPEEDKLLASPNYQAKIVKGIANGIDEFLK